MFKHRIAKVFAVVIALTAVGTIARGAVAHATIARLLPNVWSDSDPARHWYCYTQDDCYFFPDYVERTIWDDTLNDYVVDLSQGGWTDTGYCDTELESYFMDDDQFSPDDDTQCHGPIE